MAGEHASLHVALCTPPQERFGQAFLRRASGATRFVFRVPALIRPFEELEVPDFRIAGPDHPAERRAPGAALLGKPGGNKPRHDLERALHGFQVQVGLLGDYREARKLCFSSLLEGLGQSPRGFFDRVPGYGCPAGRSWLSCSCHRVH